MPSGKICYRDTVIYRIVCKDPLVTACYVGQTRNIRNRKSKHKMACNNKNDPGHNYYVYSFIRQNGGWCNWDMIQIEHYPCDTRDEADARERYHLENLGATLNKQIPGRSDAEWRADNFDVLKERSQLWRKTNADYLKQYKHKYYTENTDYIKERVAGYRVSNIDSVKLREKTRYHGNIELFKQQRRDRYADNADSINQRARNQRTGEAGDLIRQRDRERYAKKKAEQAAAAVTTVG